MTDWGRLFDWQMTLVGAVGAVLTLLFATPADTVRVASVEFRPFVPLLALFVGVTIWSAGAALGVVADQE